MKTIFAFALILIAFQSIAFATETTVECNPQNPHSVYKMKVTHGDSVKVETHAFISGHIWSSNDHIEGVITNPAQIGGMNTVEFVIDTHAQRATKKTYKFILKRPWENEVVAKCDITVSVQ